MQDTIQIDNKTIGWLVVQRGFEIPSFNFVTEKENVKVERDLLLRIVI
ncbi:phage tail family protein [Staphylococcus aureus]|uniref:Phage tail family protein n=1 Tax=Staphylococcus aureus TaxID=1280 RepID=A0A380DVG2_STAAU|nr:phage tail family protein [Staphylococcus aureus]